MELLEKPQSANAMPASIVKAIATIMAGMSAVKKSQRNTHGNYNFASTDDLYAALTLKMGEVGLIMLCLEDGEPEIKEVIKESLDKNGEKVSTRQQWLKVSFTFVLATEQDTWTDPRARRTLALQITGPQSFMAAQSYAEKSWLRSLFKIATGDMDLDGLPQTDDEGGEDGPRRQKAKPKAQTVQQAPNGTSKPLPPIVGH